MRTAQRTLLIASLLAAAVMLAGCESFDLDKLDVFGLGDKKKLPGDRKSLFPEGVPGVSQGIPPDLIKGNQPPPEPVQAEVAPAPAQKAAEVAPNPPPKRKPRPRVVRAPGSPVGEPAKVTVQPSSGQSQPASAQPSPWPATTPQQSPSPWPASPPPGTFSR